MESGDTTLTYLDGYCERAGDAAFWAEPLNFLTNGAFLLAAFLAWRFLKAQRPGTTFKSVFDIIILIVLLAAIGIGSGLWHSYATPATVMMDVIPILLFINVYLLSAYRRLFGFAWVWVLVVWGVYQALNFGSEIYLPRDTLNGSVMYLPTFAMLAVTVMGLWIRKHTHAKHMAVTLGIWCVSLVARTFDLTICDTIPLGTHFLWHVLNAVVLYRLLTRVVLSPSSLRA